MGDVVVLNIHGGIPSALIDRALCELPGFARLANDSVVYDRAYPTNANPVHALYDIVCDVPVGSASDHDVQRWLRAESSENTVLATFRANGFQTRVFGFASTHGPCNPDTKRDTALRKLDAHEVLTEPEQGGTSAMHQNTKLFSQVAQYLREGISQRFVLVNFGGCRTLHNASPSSSFLSPSPSSSPSPSRSPSSPAPAAGTAAHISGADGEFQPTMYDNDRDLDGRSQLTRSRDAHSRLASVADRHSQRANAVHDDVPERLALNRADAARADPSATQTRDDSRVDADLLVLSWKWLEVFDEGLQLILDVLHEHGRLPQAALYVYSDAPLNVWEQREILHEQGKEMFHPPWEACLRSFLIRRTHKFVTPQQVETPISLSALPSLMFDDAYLLT
jgi:hypothetical protein